MKISMLQQTDLDLPKTKSEMQNNENHMKGRFSMDLTIILDLMTQKREEHKTLLATIQRETT